MFFTGAANTSSTPIGWVGSYEVTDKGHVFTKTNQMASIAAIFTSTYHTKQLNQCLNSSASRVVNYNRLSACQGDVEPFEGNPRTRRHLKRLRNKLQQSSPGNFQHQYWPELLDNVYVFHLMVKSMSCCCVHGSWLFSNPVTYNGY